MPAPDYETSAARYQQAITALHLEERGYRAAERAAADPSAGSDLDQRAEAVLLTSADFRDAASAGRRSPDPEQRELAELRLLAGAALDLHVASDLVRRADGRAAAGLVDGEASLEGVLLDLQPILSPAPERELRGLAAATPVRAVGSASREQAVQALRDAVAAALTDIREAAAGVGQKAIGHLLGLSAPAVKEAAGLALSEVMSRLGEGLSRLVGKAVALVARAVDKLLDVLGKDAQDTARQKAAEWIEELKQGTLVGSLLDRLHEPSRIRLDVDEQLAKAPEALPLARFDDAANDVAALATRFGKQTKTIGWVLHGLAWARPWIMSLAPWGPIALPSAYLVTLGCVVYLSGDYVDWYRLGASERLNLVPGIRETVRRHLGPI